MYFQDYFFKMLSKQKADLEKQFNSASTSGGEAECGRYLAESMLTEVEHCDAELNARYTKKYKPIPYMFHFHPSMDECWINEMYMNVM
jgi:hypothetical protein